MGQWPADEDVGDVAMAYHALPSIKINLWDFMWFWILFLFVWNLSTHKHTHTHTHTHTQTHKQDCTVVQHDTKFTEDIIWMCECVCVCVCTWLCVFVGVVYSVCVYHVQWAHVLCVFYICVWVSAV